MGLSYYKRPYISFSSPLLLNLRQEITAAAVALFSQEIAIPADDLVVRFPLESGNGNVDRQTNGQKMDK